MGSEWLRLQRQNKGEEKRKKGSRLGLFQRIKNKRRRLCACDERHVVQFGAIVRPVQPSVLSVQQAGAAPKTQARQTKDDIHLLPLEMEMGATLT